MLRKEKDLYYEKSSDNRGGSSRDDGSDHSSFKRGRSSCIGTYGPRREKNSFDRERTMQFRLIKNFKVIVTETNSYEQAQVCRGGIDTKDVHPDTLESRYVPGLYFAGEILDVDGMCGGYNLTWAWASGAVSGREASF